MLQRLPGIPGTDPRKQGAYHGQIEDPKASVPVRHSTGGLGGRGRSEKTAAKVTATKLIKVKDGLVSKEDGNDTGERDDGQILCGEPRELYKEPGGSIFPIYIYKKNPYLLGSQGAT